MEHWLLRKLKTNQLSFWRNVLQLQTDQTGDNKLIFLVSSVFTYGPL